MTLVDTSAWVERDRVTGSDIDLLLDALIESGGAQVTEPVAMELHSGDGDQRAIGRLLSGAELLPFDPATDFSSAAWIYRNCRKAGHTPRSIVDCMIAAVALRNETPLLARDSDFSAIAAITGLKLLVD